jgi:Cu2+-exporting ATPase
MLAAAGQLARSGVLVRRMEAFEALNEVDTVVFDKTGTLTLDAMALGAIQVRAGMSAETALEMAAALAAHSLHPVSKALVAAQKLAGLGAFQTRDVVEVAGGGVAGRLGFGETTQTPLSLRLGSAEFCGVTASPSDGLRVFVSDDQGWLATFEIIEALRPDAQSTVAAFQAAGVTVHLLSGDSAGAAARVAAQVGIQSFRGGCSPQDKLDFLRAAQQQGHQVAVVGDGLNDGPVLAGAHVSFAFGRAVPLAQAKADFVVMGEQLKLIFTTLQLSNRTLRVVRQNLWWAAIYNAICVPLAVVGWLPAWLAGLGMAFSSLFVVLNALRLSKSAKSGGDI